MSNQGTARIPCPRCRANNFVGTPNCWSCGGSLPPPEAFAPPRYPPQPQAYSQPQPQVVQVARMRRDERSAIEAALALAGSQLPQARHPQRSSFGWLKWFGIGFAFISLIIAFLAVGHLAKTKRTAENIDQQVQQLGDLQEKMAREFGDLSRSRSTTADPN